MLLLACGSLAQIYAVSQLEGESRHIQGQWAARGQGHILCRRWLWQGSHCLITSLIGFTSWFHGILLSSEQLMLSEDPHVSLSRSLLVFLSFPLVCPHPLCISSFLPFSLSPLLLSFSFSLMVCGSLSVFFVSLSLSVSLISSVSTSLCLIRKVKSNIIRENHGPKHTQCLGVCVCVCVCVCVWWNITQPLKRMK